MTADLMDDVIEPLERLADPLPGLLCGLACSRIQAETDVKQAGDNPVEQFLDVTCLLGQNGLDQANEVVLVPFARSVPDHREDELVGGGRDRAQRDRHRDSGAVLAEPDQPGPVGHRPGRGLAHIGSPVQAVRVAQAGIKDSTRWPISSPGW